MPRVHKVWKRKQDGWHYFKLGGKQVKLSRDKTEAERAMHSLLAQERTDDTLDSKVFPTFRKIADLFLDQSSRVNRPTTLRMHRLYLQSFCDRIKRKRVDELKVHHVSKWIASTKWGPSTACSARGTVLAALNWAVEQGYIERHPLSKLKRGSHKRRERVFSADELRRIREFANPRFAAFLLGLELTGARPFSELATITAAMVDWNDEVIRLGEHKNEKKGKSRTIYLVPEMVALLRTLTDQHPTGLLFRNNSGNRWTSHDATRRLHYCTERLGIPKGTIYAVRHHRITAALEKGMTANVIAELVGNSPITIAQHNDHLSKQTRLLKAAALQAVN